MTMTMTILSLMMVVVDVDVDPWPGGRRILLSRPAAAAINQLQTRSGFSPVSLPISARFRSCGSRCCGRRGPEDSLHGQIFTIH